MGNQPGQIVISGNTARFNCMTTETLEPAGYHGGGAAQARKESRTRWYSLRPDVLRQHTDDGIVYVPTRACRALKRRPHFSSRAFGRARFCLPTIAMLDAKERAKRPFAACNFPYRGTWRDRYGQPHTERDGTVGPVLHWLNRLGVFWQTSSALLRYRSL